MHNASLSRKEERRFLPTRKGEGFRAAHSVSVLRIMSRRGDEYVRWDNARVAVGDPEAEAAMREAEQIFERERRRGGTAFKVEPGHAPRVLTEFDRTAEQTVVVPRVIGG